MTQSGSAENQRYLVKIDDLVDYAGQIAGIVASGETLTGDARARADAIADELGRRFCRRCGYCMPCEQGVPIMSAMVFDSFVKRCPPDRLPAGPARTVADGAPQCIECGACETKCPYDLPIIETIKRSLAEARQLVGE